MNEYLERKVQTITETNLRIYFNNHLVLFMKIAKFYEDSITKIFLIRSLKNFII